MWTTISTSRAAMATLRAALLIGSVAASSACTEANRIVAVQQDAGGAGDTSVGIIKDGEEVLSDAGLTSVALGGYLNGESYQQDGIVSFHGYQYAAFWNSARHVALARRALPQGAWSTLEFTDYANTASVAEDTISVGICPGDGTIHLSFDNLPLNDGGASAFHYRKSVPGLATAPADAWSVSSFSGVQSELNAAMSVSQLGYPRFVTEPGGKLLFEASLSGSSKLGADEALWEYDGNAHAWTFLGRFIAGIADNVTAYAHRLAYTRDGTRLHMAWCWRESTADPSTNHDLLYAYSDDDGRTWQSSGGGVVATSGTSVLSEKTSGVLVWTIHQNRGLMNQEHMTVDTDGEVHVLLSHMPDTDGDDANFASARGKSQFFHYLRDASGAWTRTAVGVPVVANFRGKLAVASSGNLYAILPDLRIAAASKASRYGDWTVIDTKDLGRFFSDPLIDGARLLSEDKLSVFYPAKGSPNVYVLDYTLR